MANLISNSIVIEGSEENMKPIYEFFKPFEEFENQIYELYRIGKNHEDIQKFKESHPLWEVDIFVALVPPDETYQSHSQYYGSKSIVAKYSYYEFHTSRVEPTRVSFNCTTAWYGIPDFCQKLSERYQVDVSTEFDGDGYGSFEYSNGEPIIESYYNDENEGYYLNDRSHFFDSCVTSQIEFFADDYESAEEFIEQCFGFVKDEKDLKVIIDEFNEYKKSA